MICLFQRTVYNCTLDGPVEMPKVWRYIMLNDKVSYHILPLQLHYLLHHGYFLDMQLNSPAYLTYLPAYINSYKVITNCVSRPCLQ